MTIPPSQNGSNGRGPDGRFVAGNSGGPGNPLASKVHRLRSLIHQCVTEEDFRQVIAKLLELAKDGDLAAIRELLDRMMGKPKSTIELQQRELSEAELDEEIAEALRELSVSRKQGQ